MKRSTAAELGRETVRILDAGRYQARSGNWVEIADLVKRSVEGTRSYPPNERVPLPSPGDKPRSLSVENESTLKMARSFVEQGMSPAALNFASAKHPGGGFLGGARAQEESLARSSGLYACLAGNDMYRHHREQGDALYSDYVLWSPGVPVFRDDEGQLLERPYLCSFLTSPAVNAGVVLGRDPGRRDEVRQAMRGRTEKVLAVAAAHNCDTLVLGAWGCGVFGNDCREVAELFAESLDGPFRGVFGRVGFAILDWSDDRHFIGPFQRVFGLAVDRAAEGGIPPIWQD